MRQLLVEQLREYGKKDIYPFHMPGHKRKMDFPNPFSIDITEIDGFDNLLNPEGILKDSMEWAARIYGADKTYYLVNGSSCGILSGISAVTEPGGTILMARNCHKAAYHGVILNQLKTIYSYPQCDGEYGLLCGLDSEKIEILLIENPEIQAVLLVSPTYEGIVSDIQGIAEVVHRRSLPLIVDEAHGAHFPFGNGPESAIALGADIVIQSVHKTLPSLTQTAVMHIRRGLVDEKKIERYLQIYQTSSPSYVFISSIEAAIAFMHEQGGEKLDLLRLRMETLRKELKGLRTLKLIGPELVGHAGVQAFDGTKIIIFVPVCIRIRADGTIQAMNGVELGEILRREYLLEMEMCSANYVVGIATCMDSREGLERLKEALWDLDSQLRAQKDSGTAKMGELIPLKAVMTIGKAWNGKTEVIPWKELKGKVSAEFIYIYPPGIPLIAPGEVVTESLMRQIEHYRAIGLNIHGGGDYMECVLK